MVQRLQWRGLRTQVSPLSLKCGLGRISLYSCRSWRKSFKYKDPKMTWLMMASAQPSAVFERVRSVICAYLRIRGLAMSSRRCDHKSCCRGVKGIFIFIFFAPPLISSDLPALQVAVSGCLCGDQIFF
ncbi:uncharacterized protein LOC131168629 isoform X1 [Malania oleifera]|uniref:uncharacterized protein LOC131168629 isoform X1 n=1 Tax=Malania oleifera TaxID=397392 RepID=UPI0025AD9E75|nr:uncharacterized protein LOC131168629 isoform X1 [Malania oleifera]